MKKAPLLPIALGGLGLVALSFGSEETASAAAPGEKAEVPKDGEGERSSKPARALSVSEAESEISFYVAAGVVRNAKVGNLTIGGIESRRVSFGSNLAGVQVYALDKPFLVHDVDVRFGCLLVRLAMVLSEHHGVTAIETLGIFPGAGKADDCHNQGRAIDLSGLRFEDGRRLSVLDDWGKRPAPYDLQTAKTTEYRLHEGDPGFQIFQDIYRFATEEGADRTDAYVTNEGPPTVIGDHSYVITPDHPTPSLRLAHQNHFHIQIGPTRME